VIITATSLLQNAAAEQPAPPPLFDSSKSIGVHNRTPLLIETPAGDWLRIEIRL